MLSFFHNNFLLISLHFCIKSTIKIVVVVVVHACILWSAQDASHDIANKRSVSCE